MNKKDIRTSAAFTAVCAVFCTMLWGSAFPAIKTGYELFRIPAQDIPSKLIFAGARFSAAGIMILLAGLCIMHSRRRELLIRKKDIFPVISLSFFQTFLQYLLLYVGLTSVTGTRSSILTSVSTFASVILSAVFFRSDRLSAGKLCGCAVGMAGLVYMNAAGGFSEFSLMGDGLVILSNISGAAGNVISKAAAPGRDPLQLSGWQLTLGGLALTAAGIISGGRLVFYDSSCFLILLYLALMAGTAFLIWTMLIFRNPVSRVAVFSLLIPVFGTLWSGLFLGEELLSLRNIISLALVCLGIFLANKKHNKKTGDVSI